MNETQQIPILVYNSNSVDAFGYNSLERCKVVSERMQYLQNVGYLNYISSGYFNNLPVICAIHEIGENCFQNNIIYALPANSSSDIIEQAIDIFSTPIYLTTGNVPLESNLFSDAEDFTIDLHGNPTTPPPPPKTKPFIITEFFSQGDE